MEKILDFDKTLDEKYGKEGTPERERFEQAAAEHCLKKAVVLSYTRYKDGTVYTDKLEYSDIGEAILALDDIELDYKEEIPDWNTDKYDVKESLTSFCCINKSDKQKDSIEIDILSVD